MVMRGRRRQSLMKLLLLTGISQCAKLGLRLHLEPITRTYVLVIYCLAHRQAALVYNSYQALDAELFVSSIVMLAVEL
jgi:hypothetical protein